MKAIRNFLVDLAKEFWSGTTVQTSETVKFEMGGLVICAIIGLALIHIFVL